MFRLFDMLGRSTAMRALDDALRAAGVHPLLVPEPVKLTLIQLCKRLAGGTTQETAVTQAAQVLSYCMLGHDGFAASNDADAACHIDKLVETALEEGDSLDAKVVLLVVHAGLIAPDIADRIDLDEA